MKKRNNGEAAKEANELTGSLLFDYLCNLLLTGSEYGAQHDQKVRTKVFLRF